MHALIVVDMQNDFMPGGPLGVAEADTLVAPINRLIARLPVVVATQDWHPPGHGSFASAHPGRRPGEVVPLAGLEQVLWPDHCVQHTPGAALVAGLDTAGIDHVVTKGSTPDVDSYSGFFDNARRHDTGLRAWLRDAGVTHVHVCGVATDYCVRFTALDALTEGFDVTLHAWACRGVELAPGDVAGAIAAIEAAGATVTTDEAQAFAAIDRAVDRAAPALDRTPPSR